jgi:putative transcriptional regulator
VRPVEDYPRAGAAAHASSAAARLLETGQTAPMRSTRGRLLLAGPTLRDPNFFRAVVLMLDHDEDGALGLVLNRPTEHDVARALPPWAGRVSDPAVVFIGGPVAPETALALGRLPSGDAEPLGFAPLIGPLGIVDLERLEVAQAVRDIRVFAGYSGWGPGQLEGELAADAWLVLDSLPSDVTSTDPAQLWETVLRRQPGALSLLAAYPDEPAWN